MPAPSYDNDDYLIRIGVLEGSPPKKHYLLQRLNSHEEHHGGVVTCYSVMSPLWREFARILYGPDARAISHRPDEVKKLPFDRPWVVGP
jgi:hypothetical protein